MLDGMRKHATSWVAQVFLGLLTLSFVVWGISDIFRGFVSDTVATVGGEKIRVPAFQRAFDSQRKAFSQQLGRQLTSDQARLFGLPAQVVDRLVSSTALDIQARSFGLGISSQSLTQQIVSDPIFFGQSGKFDPARFTQVLNDESTSEAVFMADRRLAELRSQIAAGTVGGGLIPETLKRALHQYENEERAVRYLLLPTSLIDDVGEPNAAEQQAFFDQNKARWRANEYRGLVALKLEASDLAKPEAVSDADAKAYFEKQKSQYVIPERRDVWQVLFKTRTEAEAAAAKLKAGTGFDALLSELNRKSDDVHLGVTTRTAIADKAVADAAFALEANQSSGVVDGRFGPLIVYVSDIQKGVDTAFDAVADFVKINLATDRAATKLAEVQDQVEDLRAGGSGLPEVAEKLGVKAVTIAAVDRGGKAPDGSDVNVPGGLQLLGTAFESDVGVENDPQPFGTRGAIWFEVTKVEAARDKSLTEVKDQVVAGWKASKLSEKLTVRAKQMADKVAAGGADIAQLADEGKLALVELPKITRKEQASAQLPAEIVSAAFSGKEGSVAIAATQDGSVAVVKIDKVRLPEFQPKDPVAVRTYDQREQEMAVDLLGAYAKQLQNQLGVRVDQAMVSQALGAGSGG